MRWRPERSPLFGWLVCLTLWVGMLEVSNEIRAQDRHPRGAPPRVSLAAPAVGNAILGSSAAASATQASTVFSAVINANGTLARGKGVTSARRINPPNQVIPGLYEVVFDAEVRNGTFVATIGHSTDQLEEPGLVTVSQRAGNARAVFVETRDRVGKHADRGFHLIVLPNSDMTGSPNPTMKVVDVVIYSHSEVALTNDEAKQILDEMGKILQTQDTSNDVATPVSFRLVGGVQPMPPNIPGAISTPSDVAKALALPGIKVVRDLEHCGTQHRPDIIGCAAQSVVVNEIVEYNPDEPLDVREQAVLWLHEYGHNASLNHREDVPSALQDPHAVMSKVVASEHRLVDDRESQAYLLRGPSAAIGGVAVAVAPPRLNELQPAQRENSPRPDDVRVFVRRHYAEGVPPDVASTYKAEDVDVLLGMLANPGEDEKFLPEIVATLCYIGDEKAIKPLTEFVKAPAASSRAFRGKKSALVHLGELVYEVRARGAAPTQSEAALKLLSTIASSPRQARVLAVHRAQKAMEEVTTANTARAAVTGARPRTAPTPDQLAAELAVSATWGLALSGAPSAQAAIGELRAANSPAFEPVKQLAPTAARVHQEVRASSSLKEYRMRSEHGGAR